MGKAALYVSSVSEYISIILNIWETMEREIYRDIHDQLKGVRENGRE